MPAFVPREMLRKWSQPQLFTRVAPSSCLPADLRARAFSRASPSRVKSLGELLAVFPEPRRRFITKRYWPGSARSMAIPSPITGDFSPRTRCMYCESSTRVAPSNPRSGERNGPAQADVANATSGRAAKTGTEKREYGFICNPLCCSGLPLPTTTTTRQTTSLETGPLLTDEEGALEDSGPGTPALPRCSTTPGDARASRRG